MAAATLQSNVLWLQSCEGGGIMGLRGGGTAMVVPRDVTDERAAAPAVRPGTAVDVDIAEWERAMRRRSRTRNDETAEAHDPRQGLRTIADGFVAASAS